MTEPPVTVVKLMKLYYVGNSCTSKHVRYLPGIS